MSVFHAFQFSQRFTFSPALKKQDVQTLLPKKLEKNATPQIIQSALITAFVTALIGTKSAPFALYSAITASYLAITSGRVGAVVRNIREVSNEVGQYIINLLNESETGKKLFKTASSSIDTTLKALAENTTAAEEVSKEAKEAREDVGREEAADMARITSVIDNDVQHIFKEQGEVEREAKGAAAVIKSVHDPKSLLEREVSDIYKVRHEFVIERGEQCKMMVNFEKLEHNSLIITEEQQEARIRALSSRAPPSKVANDKRIQEEQDAAKKGSEEKRLEERIVSVKRLFKEMKMAAEKSAEEKRWEVEQTAAKKAAEERLLAEDKTTEKKQLGEVKMSAEKAVEEKLLEDVDIAVHKSRLEKERVAADEKSLEQERVTAEEMRLDEENIAAEKAFKEKHLEEGLTTAEEDANEKCLEKEQIAYVENQIADVKAAKETPVEKKLVAAEEERLELKRIADEKACDENRLNEEQIAPEEKRLEEARIDDEQVAEEKRLQKERVPVEEKRSGQKQIADEKAAEERRLQKEHVAAQEKRLKEARITDEKDAEEKRLEKDRAATEKKLLEQKRIDDENLAEEKSLEKKRAAAEEKALEQKRIADKAKKLEEERWGETAFNESIKLAHVWYSGEELADALKLQDDKENQGTKQTRKISLREKRMQHVSQKEPPKIMFDKKSRKVLGSLAHEAVSINREQKKKLMHDTKGVLAIKEIEQQQQQQQQEKGSASLQEKMAISYESMTVLELKDALRSRGLKTTGKKAELIDRLKNS